MPNVKLGNNILNGVSTVRLQSVNGGYENYIDESSVESNAYVTRVTFSARLRNGVVLELPDRVLAHKDDASFSMTYLYEGDTLVNYRSYAGMVCNKLISYNSQFNYGVYCYSSINGVIYYPINSTDADFTQEGVYKIKFYIIDKKLYIAEDIGSGFDIGTYKFSFSW